MLDVYRQFNRLMYHTNWTFQELYNLPVMMRDFICKDIAEMLEEINKKMKEESNKQ